MTNVESMTNIEHRTLNIDNPIGCVYWSSVPVGTTENSPGRKPWDCEPFKLKAPEGRQKHRNHRQVIKLCFGSEQIRARYDKIQTFAVQSSLRQQSREEFQSCYKETDPAGISRTALLIRNQVHHSAVSEIPALVIIFAIPLRSSRLCVKSQYIPDLQSNLTIPTRNRVLNN